MRLLHARAVVVGDGAPILDGAVVLGSEGQVVAVGPASAVLAQHAGPKVERIEGVMFPGLVNAHTHLELSALRGRVPGGAGFVPWLEQLVRVRSQGSPEDDAEAIDEAASQLDAFGTAAVGEVTNSLAAVRSLATRGFAGCVFHEVFGIDRAAVLSKIARMHDAMRERLGAWPSEDLAYAPSPHTLYTTHAEAVAELLRQGREAGLRESLHLAEHAAERRFLEHGDGPVAAFYEARLKVDRRHLSWPGQSPVAYAERLGALSPSVVLVHLVDAHPAELERVARHRAPVVLCPRSNLFIETRFPPLLAMRAAGICPALGTDSLASNASLDVLLEARAIADRFPSVHPAEILTMATWWGAQALGRSDLGRIAPGSRPGIVAVDGDPGSDPSAFVLRNVHAPRRWISRRRQGPKGPS